MKQLGASTWTMRKLGALLFLALLPSCRGCGSDTDITSVASRSITLRNPQIEVTIPPPPPPVQEPEYDDPPPEEPPAQPDYDALAYDDVLTADEVLSSLTEEHSVPVPPGTWESEDLTQRLKEKMAEAYSGDLEKVPDATIYLSNDSLEDFVYFYEERGYQVTRVTVPVRRILQPVLRDRPELADQIRIEDYADVDIHQVMVRGTGISAADRFIDPDTYEVIEQLFVTEMPVK